MKKVERLSFHPRAYNKPLKNFLGKGIYFKNKCKSTRDKDEFIKLSFVDSIFETWKLRWTILTAKDEIAATNALKKYKHHDGTDMFKNSSHWRSCALENMMKEYNNERDRKVVHEGSLLLYEKLLSTI